MSARDVITPTGPMVMAGLTKEPLIMAGVSRVSLELQANQGYSLESQPARFREIGDKYGCVFPPEFMVEDAGFSGDDFHRPSIKRILALGRAGKIQGVAWTHLDRFARNVEGGLRLIR